MKEMSIAEFSRNSEKEHFQERDLKFSERSREISECFLQTITVHLYNEWRGKMKREKMENAGNKIRFLRHLKICGYFAPVLIRIQQIIEIIFGAQIS